MTSWQEEEDDEPWTDEQFYEKIYILNVSTDLRHNIDFENLRCEYKNISKINEVKWN